MRADHWGVLRAGIIGAGPAGRAHARALAALGETVRLVGIHDVDPGLALQVGGELAAQPFEEPDELLRAVDFVIVASATAHHAEHALRAAAMGVDVLVERPVVGYPQDLVRLHNAIARAPKRPIVQAGHVALFDPTLRTLVRALAPHEPAVVEIRNETPRASDAPSVEELLHDAVTMLHPLTRCGPHAVHAAGRRRRRGGGFEHITALVSCESGPIATIHAGHLVAEPIRRFMVTAETADLEGDSLSREVTVSPRASRASGLEASTSPRLVLHPDGEDAHVAQARAFLSAIVGRSVPVVPLAAALPALELTDQILRKAQMGERLSGSRSAA